MGRRRMLPSRDPPVRAHSVAQCRAAPRRRSLAACAVFANSLGAVAAACGRLVTADVGVYRAERRIRSMFKQSLSGQGLLNASLDAAARRIEGDLREHGYYLPPC